MAARGVATSLENGCSSRPDRSRGSTSSRACCSIPATSSSSSCRPTPARSPRSGTCRRAWSACRRRPTASISTRSTRPISALVREGRRVRVLYVVPNFQNPTGLLIGLDKRRRLLEWAERRDVLIVEDDPYRELYFEDSATESGRPADQSRRRRRTRRLPEQLLEDAGAGLPRRLDRRAGAARGEVRDGEAGRGPAAPARSTSASSTKRAAAACSTRQLPMLRRALPAEARRDGRGAATASSARAVSWPAPRGGFFLWATLPEPIDADAMIARAVEHGVIYVAGEAFFVERRGRSNHRAPRVLGAIARQDSRRSRAARAPPFARSCSYSRRRARFAGQRRRRATTSMSPSSPPVNAANDDTCTGSSEPSAGAITERLGKRYRSGFVPVAACSMIRISLARPATKIGAARTTGPANGRNGTPLLPALRSVAAIVARARDCRVPAKNDRARPSVLARPRIDGADAPDPLDLGPMWRRRSRTACRLRPTKSRRRPPAVRRVRRRS